MKIDYGEIKYLYQCNRELDIYEKLKKKFPNASHEDLVKNQKRLLKQVKN